MKFTKEAVANLTLPESKQDHFEWDPSLPAFGVRLRRGSGQISRSWVVQYRCGSHQRRESLGDVRKIDLEDARKIARKRFAQIELGIDPAAERKNAHAKATAAKLTLAVVVERYLEAKKDVVRPSTYKAAEQYFAIHWKPLRNRPIHGEGKIERADIAARLQELTKAHGRTSAGRARDNLSALYGWAMREGLCEVNPVIATNDPSDGIQPRDRVLTPDEIRIIWKECGEMDDFGRIVRLLLLTGCRREEIAQLRRSEINMQTGVMIIDGSRTKNHQTLELTLPALALDILQSTPHRADREYFFGLGRAGFSGFSYSMMALRSRIADAEGNALAPWRLHDLRRTFRTGLGKLGVAPHVAELAIGHVKRGIEAVYDRHRYQREIKSALAIWADHVAAVVEVRTSNIVTLQQSA